MGEVQTIHSLRIEPSENLGLEFCDQEPQSSWPPAAFKKSPLSSESWG